MQSVAGSLAQLRAAEQAAARADAKYPTVWYQNKYWQQGILIAIGISLALYQLWVGWANMPDWFLALGVAGFLGGWVADILTTDAAVRLLPEYRKRGLAFPLVERNPYLSDYPSLREQLLGLSSLIKVVALLVAPFVPAVAWGGAWSGFSAALNNRRNTKSVRYQLHQYDLLRGAREKE